MVSWCLFWLSFLFLLKGKISVLYTCCWASFNLLPSSCHILAFLWWETPMLSIQSCLGIWVLPESDLSGHSNSYSSFVWAYEARLHLALWEYEPCSLSGCMWRERGNEGIRENEAVFDLLPTPILSHPLSILIGFLFCRLPTPWVEILSHPLHSPCTPSFNGYSIIPAQFYICRCRPLPPGIAYVYWWTRWFSRVGWWAPHPKFQIT